MLQMILFSAGAGIIGTGLGGLICVLMIKRSSQSLTCCTLSFAAGVMISIVCFNMIPEALGIANISVCLYGLIIGIVVIMILNRIVDNITGMNEEKLRVHHTHEELFHESPIINDSARMLRTGTLMFIAIGLHNIPEGVAIGAGGSHNFQLGALLAIVIALHNIPEGMAVAAPLLAGGVNRGKVVYLTALNGASTLLGGIAGVIFGSISDFAVALSLASAGGAMLYVVFGEIIPQSIVMTRSRRTTIVTLFGIIVGLLVTRV